MGKPGVSEQQFQRKLNNPWIARFGDLPEGWAVCDIAVRDIELGVVEGIKELGAELQFFMFGEPGGLQQSEVGVVDSRAAAERARRVADRAERLGSERVGIKVLIGNRLAVRCAGSGRGAGSQSAARLARILCGEFAHQVRFAGILEVLAILELEVAPGSDSDGETALKTEDARHAPAIHGLPHEAVLFRNREFPVITQNESLGSVEQRKRPAAAEAERIKSVFEA